MYGDEESGSPPDELYDREDAEEVIKMAEYVCEIVTALLPPGG
ncbi:MAG: hypothetical protein QXI90_02560 [Thermofilum sp.]